ncbi:cupin domain-containing protein [Longispora sp. K20-0274]|uniref:cupin domain-containing protein n=1 Tax=Longispora sp. K20-0274 TaxID=3088255 RepID=UPI00399A045C
MPQPIRPTPADLIARHGLAPLPAEGGWYRRTWAGPTDPTGRPAGSAILVLLTDGPDGFSALHRLPIDEVWFHHDGDPVDLVLLRDDGDLRIVRLGPGGVPQAVAPAGVWMAARPAAPDSPAPGAPDPAGAGRWALCGTTMAPGFLPGDYEGADPARLAAAHPRHADLIGALTRPDAPAHMPADVDG